MPERADNSPGVATTLLPVMTNQLSPGQTRIRVLAEVLLDELHENARGPLQGALCDALNEVLLELDGATLTATLVL